MIIKNNNEHPILFSAAMVCAILSGQKTQTRRVIKAVRQNNTVLTGKYKKTVMHVLDERLPCPYGKPGDRLWVRESFQPLFANDHCLASANYKTGIGYKVSYPATDGIKEYIDADKDELTARVRPSIHMPRWACRLVLEIVNVRVERLKDITPDDSLAEGVTRKMRNDFGFSCDESEEAFNFTQSKHTFSLLWKSINGVESWNENPWVFVIEFKQVDK